MIREKRERELVIDLTGPEGNAFCLLGYAKQWAEQLGFNWEEIRKEATSGDYENLLEVLEKHFGSVVVFER